MSPASYGKFIARTDGTHLSTLARFVTDHRTPSKTTVFTQQTGGSETHPNAPRTQDPRSVPAGHWRAVAGLRPSHCFDRRSPRLARPARQAASQDRHDVGSATQARERSLGRIPTMRPLLIGPLLIARTPDTGRGKDACGALGSADAERDGVIIMATASAAGSHNGLAKEKGRIRSLRELLGHFRFPSEMSLPARCPRPTWAPRDENGV
jgi:hypothetical protein